MIQIILNNIPTGEQFIFPMNPETIKCSCGTNFQSYDFMLNGECKIPRGAKLTGFSWNGILPGASRQNLSFVKEWQNPDDIQWFWSRIKNNGDLLQLIVTDTPINHNVYLEDYDVEYSGGHGDYNYEISFIEARDAKVYTLSELNMQPAATENKSPTYTRPEAQMPNSYTVCQGDTLWAIAQRYLGNGARYGEIVALNQDKISDPHWIYPGQVLVLP